MVINMVYVCVRERVCIDIMQVILSVKILWLIVGNGYWLCLGRASQRQLGEIYGDVRRHGKKTSTRAARVTRVIRRSAVFLCSCFSVTTVDLSGYENCTEVGNVTILVFVTPIDCLYVYYSHTCKLSFCFSELAHVMLGPQRSSGEKLLAVAWMVWMGFFCSSDAIPVAQSVLYCTTENA